VAYFLRLIGGWVGLVGAAFDAIGVCTSLAPMALG